MQQPWRKADLERLAYTDVFRKAKREDLERLTEDPRCTLERFRKGEEIYSPEHFRRSLGALLSGAALVTKGDLVVNQLGPGDLFGAAVLFTKEGFENTITAISGCKVGFFPQPLVMEFLDRSPGACGGYIAYLSGRIRFLNRKIEGLTAPGAAERLRRYLWGESGHCGTLSCPSATELARRLDVSRASLYRAFQVLEEEGAIQRNGKSVAILDREKLRTAPSVSRESG